MVEAADADVANEAAEELAAVVRARWGASPTPAQPSPQ
jgi:hypothetical protein